MKKDLHLVIRADFFLVPYIKSFVERGRDSHFGPQRGHGRLHEVLRLLRVDLEALCGCVQVVTGALCRQLEPVCDPDRVDPLVDEGLCLLQQRPAQHHHAGGAVADLVVLRLRQLHQQLRDLKNKKNI